MLQPFSHPLNAPIPLPFSGVLCSHSQFSYSSMIDIDDIKYDLERQIGLDVDNQKQHPIYKTEVIEQIATSMQDYLQSGFSWDYAYKASVMDVLTPNLVLA